MSEELLPCPFCGSEAKERDGKVTCSKAWQAIDQCAMFPHWATRWAWNSRSDKPCCAKAMAFRDHYDDCLYCGPIHDKYNGYQLCEKAMNMVYAAGRRE